MAADSTENSRKKNSASRLLKEGKSKSSICHIQQSTKSDDALGKAALPSYLWLGKINVITCDCFINSKKNTRFCAKRRRDEMAAHKTIGNVQNKTPIKMVRTRGVHWACMFIYCENEGCGCLFFLFLQHFKSRTCCLDNEILNGR